MKLASINTSNTDIKNSGLSSLNTSNNDIKPTNKSKDRLLGLLGSQNVTLDSSRTFNMKEIKSQIK